MDIQHVEELRKLLHARDALLILATLARREIACGDFHFRIAFANPGCQSAKHLRVGGIVPMARLVPDLDGVHELAVS